MTSKLLRDIDEHENYIEKYRTFVLYPEFDAVVEIENKTTKATVWTWNDFLDREARFADLEQKGEWSDAWLEREYHRKGIDDFMKGKVYTKYTKSPEQVIQQIKDLPYTIFDSNYSKKQLHKCPFHNDSNSSLSFRGKYWKCFSPITKIITKNGVLEIKDIFNKEIEIINGNGQWEKTKFVSCGKQNILEIKLRKHGKEKTIYTTAEHEWFIKRTKNKVKTTDLRIGDFLKTQSLFLNKEIIPSTDGMIHGFIYGDGSISYKTKNKFYMSAYIYNKIKWDFCKKYFKDLCYKPKTKKIKVLGAIYYPTIINLKNIPDLNNSLEYLYGFLVGYFVADGHANKESLQFNSSKKEDLIKIKHICTILGIMTHPIGETIRNCKSNSGIVHYKKDKEYFLYTMRLVSTTIPNNFFVSGKKFKTKRKYHNSLGWRVINVNNTYKKEEVFCCETSTQSFVLEDFILTSNCFGCNEGGSIIDFYMKLHSVNFIEAVNNLKSYL